MLRKAHSIGSFPLLHETKYFEVKNNFNNFWLCMSTCEMRFNTAVGEIRKLQFAVCFIGISYNLIKVTFLKW